MKRVQKFRLTSVAPLLMHNGQLSDPLNPWAQAIKRITDKRKKTLADLEEVGRLEWYGGLYSPRHQFIYTSADASRLCRNDRNPAI